MSNKMMPKTGSEIALRKGNELVRLTSKLLQTNS